jgi:hypothetical protein
VGDHGDAVGSRGAKAARVVEVMVAVDDVADGLARHELARLVERGHRAFVVEGTLDHADIVLHLDDHAVVRAPGQIPDAESGLLRDDARVGHRGLAHVVRHRHVGRGIGLDVTHGQVERGKPPDALADPHGDLHPAEIAIVRVDELGRRVAGHGVGPHGIDLPIRPASSRVALAMNRPGEVKAIVRPLTEAP